MMLTEPSEESIYPLQMPLSVWTENKNFGQNSKMFLFQNISVILSIWPVGGSKAGTKLLM